MTTLNQELYEALTKRDIAELKAEIQAMLHRQLLTLTVIILGSMSILTGIFIAVAKRLP